MHWLSFYWFSRTFTFNLHVLTFKISTILAFSKSSTYYFKTSTITLDNVPRFIASRETDGLIKLVADSKTDKLLGATILAPEAGDSIQTMVIALKAGLTTEELGDTIFPYLTAVEGLKLAAQSFNKDVKKLSCCAG